MSEIGDRKLAHLELCASEDVEARRSTLLDHVHLLHEALPELSCDEVDPSVGAPRPPPPGADPDLGHDGRAPSRRATLNRALATAAQKLGLGHGRRLAARDARRTRRCADTYQVRDVAPDVLLLANLGAVQAREAGVDARRALVERDRTPTRSACT